MLKVTYDDLGVIDKGLEHLASKINKMTNLGVVWDPKVDGLKS